MDSKPRRRGFNLIPRMFKRNSREQLKEPNNAISVRGWVFFKTDSCELSIFK